MQSLEQGFLVLRGVGGGMEDGNLLPKEHLAISGDIFVCQSFGGGVGSELPPLCTG